MILLFVGLLLGQSTVGSAGRFQCGEDAGGKVCEGSLPSAGNMTEAPDGSPGEIEGEHGIGKQEKVRESSDEPAVESPEWGEDDGIRGNRFRARQRHQVDI